MRLYTAFDLFDFLFFFFKQKTAYEMRISDWSSDVCSSDLYAVSRQQVTAMLSPHTSKSAEYECPFPLPKVAAQELLHAQARERSKQVMEIGRASCRERVCQYV